MTFNTNLRRSTVPSGRSILLERALTKNMLQSGSPKETVSWFNENYPMNDMGRRAERGHRQMQGVQGAHNRL